MKKATLASSRTRRGALAAKVFASRRATLEFSRASGVGSVRCGRRVLPRRRDRRAFRSGAGAALGRRASTLRLAGDSGSPQQLPAPSGVRIGPLVIWPSVRTHVAPAGSQAIAWQFVSKAPIVLPARTRAVLAIASEAVELAAFQSARRSIGWVSSVRFEACREREPAFPGAYRGTVGRYTGFPFAIASTRRSACIPMEVWLDGATKPIRRTVPFGRPAC